MSDAFVLAAVAAGGAVSTWYALRILRAALRGAPHVRTNYRGREVLATAGAALVPPLILGGVVALLVPVRPLEGSRAAAAMLVAGLGMAAAGYADDVFGDRRAGGFAGHARALLAGRVTTGAFKAVVGGLVGLVAAAMVGRRGIWILVGGVVVALAANLANLVDLRPGRALKAWFVCSLALVAHRIPVGGDIVILAVTGGGSVFIVAELREDVMLGDTGAGLVGTLLGVAAVAALGGSALVALLIILASLTVLSEAVSFTQVIEAVPPLRWLDGLGRHP